MSINNVQIQQPVIPGYSFKYGPGLFNQNMAQAQAAGDERFQMKQLDRAGMSRGGAQRQQANAQGANAIANGIAQAYGQLTQDDAGIAGMSMESQGDQERAAQAFAKINAQDAQRRNSMFVGLLQGLL